jgi:hypothetical protein
MKLTSQAAAILATAALLGIAASGPAHAQNAPGDVWNQLQDADYHFAVDMPCVANKTDGTTDGGGATAPTRNYVCDLGPRGALVIYLGQLSAVSHGQPYDRQKVLDASASSVRQSMGLEVDSDTPIQDGDVMGRDIQGHGKDGVMHIRVLDRHGMLYELIVAGPSALPPEDGRVMSSFHFTD